jgi:hypothetical protein
MNCKEVQALLIDYLDGAMDVSAAGVMEQHLEGCTECKRESEDLQLLMAAMQNTVAEPPPPALREGFDILLQSELNMLTTANIIQEFGPATKKPARSIRLSWSSPAWQIAAALILVAAGVVIGRNLPSKQQPGVYAQMDSLHNEIRSMRQEIMLNMIDDESASQRIKAVSYAEEMSNPDQQVIDVLIHTLNNDKNVNVRLAALYSLSRFADRRAVRDSLVNSLPTQTEPIIQVVLINLLAEKRDTRAIAPIRNIITNKKTLKEVKDAAQRSLQSF